MIAGGADAGIDQCAPQPRHGVVIGAKNFDEQYILAKLMAIAPQQCRLRRQRKRRSRLDHRVPGAGRPAISTPMSIIPAPLGQHPAPHRHAGPRRPCRRSSPPGCANHYGISTLGSLGFENAYIFAMRADRARALNIKAWPILLAIPNCRSAGDFEIFSRPEWRAVAAAYGLAAMKRRQYQPDFLLSGRDQRRCRCGLGFFQRWPHGALWSRHPCRSQTGLAAL